MIQPKLSTLSPCFQWKKIETCLILLLKSIGLESVLAELCPRLGLCTELDKQFSKNLMKMGLFLKKMNDSFHTSMYHTVYIES